MKAFYFLFLFPVFASAQGSKPSATRECRVIVKPEYPKKAEENNICGEVIVEVSVDSFGLRGNERVLKGLGYGCDEAALKMVRSMNGQLNRCERWYGLVRQQPRTEKQPIIFQCPDKETDQ